VSTRSRQAFHLARRLTERAGVPVTIEWHGASSPRNRPWTGWRITWTDGPTVPTMTAHVAQLADRAPALDVAELRYDRGPTDLAELTALLGHLGQRPELAARITPMLARDAWEHTEHPERLDEHTQGRARALLAEHDTALGAHTDLAQRGHAGGWDAIVRWLDQLAATLAAEIIDLAAERAARRTDDEPIGPYERYSSDGIPLPPPDENPDLTEALDDYRAAIDELRGLD